MSLISNLSNNRTWNRHGIKIVWAISIVWLLLVISYVAYSEYTEHQASQADLAPQTLPPLASNTGPTYRVDDIVSANLFGDPRPQEVITENIPKTNLNLKLIGVLWASDQDMARVIIQSGNKKAGLYGIGESIQGAGASVKEIHDSEILISRNGATEKLPLIKGQSDNGKSIISYESGGLTRSGSASLEASFEQTDTSNISRSSNEKPISPNGENRKIRKPNFSGLDRALQKMGEI